MLKAQPQYCLFSRPQASGGRQTIPPSALTLPLLPRGLVGWFLQETPNIKGSSIRSDLARLNAQIHVQNKTFTGQDLARTG